MLIVPNKPIMPSVLMLSVANADCPKQTYYAEYH
jgi:hypothetical protein